MSARVRKGDWVVAGGRTPGEIGYCKRCGQGLTLGTQLLVVAAAAMKAFVKAHSSCREPESAR